MRGEKTKLVLERPDMTNVAQYVLIAAFAAVRLPALTRLPSRVLAAMDMAKGMWHMKTEVVYKIE